MKIHLTLNIKRKSVPKLLATSVNTCSRQCCNTYLQRVLCNLAICLIRFFKCKNNSTFFAPNYSGTNNLVKLPYARVMQIATYREGGGIFTSTCITFFYNILFFQVIPLCPGLLLIALEENRSLFYFSSSRQVFSRWGILGSFVSTTAMFPREESCPAGSNVAALYLRGINCPNSCYSWDLHFLSSISSEHLGALDQLLARHSSTSHYMHWLLLHKVSCVKEAEANGSGSHRHCHSNWAE